MKKIISILLAAFLCLSALPFTVFAEESVLYRSVVDVISSESGYGVCQVYFYENDCYMHIDDIVRYTRSNYTVDGDMLKTSHGTRTINIDLSSNTLTEDGITSKMKTLRNGDTIVVHAYPMLTYLGATCSTADGKLIIDMPECTIWEGTIRLSQENYFTLETFGGECEQNTRLILNGILKIFETGLSGILFENSIRDAFINAMQVDPLKYTGGWDKKCSIDEKYGSLASAMISANDFSADFSEFFDSSSDAVSNIIINYLRKTNERDVEFLSELDGLENLFDISAVASSFISNLSINAKCTDDSVQMIEAFANHTLKTGKYYVTANLVKKKIQNELSSTIDSAKVAIGGKITSEIVDEFYKAVDKSVAGKFKPPQSSYFSVLGLFEESLNISVMLHKLFYGENNAFAYASAETEAIHLLLLKNELIESMRVLGEQIQEENYSNSEHIEEYRLINAFYYRVLISANEKLVEMVVAQGKENQSDMKAVIDHLHNNNDLFAKNLYILTTATGTAFPDVEKISNSNQWDDDTSIKANAEEVPNGIEGLGAPSLKVILTDIEADSIQYYNCAESGNFAVIGKDGKYGIIGYDGKMILPISYDRIDPGSGYSYDYLIAIKDLNDFSEWGSYVDKNGQLQEGYPDGGDVRPSSYWYDGSVVIFNADSDVMKLEDFLNDEWYSKYGLKTPGLVLDLRAWNSDKLFPVQKISGYTNHYGYQEPHFDTMQFALMDMKTHKLLSDFVYENIDNYNGVSEGLFAVKKNGKWGFVNESGTVVVDFLYDPYESYTSYGKTYEFVYTAVNGHIAVLKDGKWGLIDTHGNTIIETTYDGISQVNPDGMFWLQGNGTWSLYQLTKYESNNSTIIDNAENTPTQEVSGAYWSPDNPYKSIYESYGRSQVYFFSDSSSRLLTSADIAGMNIDELCLARNEILARNGYLFSDDHLREYFQHFTWYQPTTAMGDQDAVSFNSVEYDNIRFLRARQSELEGQ